MRIQKQPPLKLSGDMLENDKYSTKSGQIMAAAERLRQLQQINKYASPVGNMTVLVREYPEQPGIHLYTELITLTRKDPYQEVAYITDLSSKDGRFPAVDDFCYKYYEKFQTAPVLMVITPEAYKNLCESMPRTFMWDPPAGGVVSPPPVKPRVSFTMPPISTLRDYAEEILREEEKAGADYAREYRKLPAYNSEVKSEIKPQKKYEPAPDLPRQINLKDEE